jgi:uncharacterized protein YukE
MVVEFKEIRMDFEYMDDLHRAYNELAQALESARLGVLQIVQLLEDGALLGLAGDRFSAGCKDMAKQMLTLQEMTQDQAEDILSARAEMEMADEEAGEFYR